MNTVISILPTGAIPGMMKICEHLGVPVSLTLWGQGTATKSMLDLLGLEAHEKRVVFALASDEATKKLIELQRLHLYIDAPGNGITVSVPMKSIAGRSTHQFLTKGEEAMKAPELNYDYELIMVIANEGNTDTVMEAAREAGARGGTVLHGKGTLTEEASKFYNVSLASEKEMILIVASVAQKAAIMQSVIKAAGPATEAGAICFSLPVSEVAGFMSKSEDAQSTAL